MSGRYIVIAGSENALQLSMSVGVTLGTYNGLGQFTNNSDEDDVQYFFADGGDTIVTCPSNYIAIHVFTHQGAGRLSGKRLVQGEVQAEAHN